MKNSRIIGNLKKPLKKQGEKKTKRWINMGEYQRHSSEMMGSAERPQKTVLSNKEFNKNSQN